MKVFVTTGAIAPFYDLIQACLDTTVVARLVELGYDELRIQYGKGGEFFSSHVPTVSGITITGFDFTPDIQSEVESSDLIISHAGTGSILDAVRSHKPLIVVANTQLMDNHQLEIANQFSQFGYLLVCKPTQEYVKRKVVTDLRVLIV